jgi:hypothetical protein
MNSLWARIDNRRAHGSYSAKLRYPQFFTIHERTVRLAVASLPEQGSPPRRAITLLAIAASVLALFGGCRRDEKTSARLDRSSHDVAIAASEPDGGAVMSFEQPLDAFRYVLAMKPRVLAVGEAHAQRGTEGIASSTRRFMEDFLPTLAGRTSGLVLELWLGEPKCGKVIETVHEQQKPVTATQAKTNPNELVALGDRAYALGIRPYPLRPSCEEYGPIADAGADAVPKMLELIARLSQARLEGLLSATDAGADSLVLAYGGALHNDVSPARGKESFSFGPAMVRATHGRYVELDVIVGDYVRNEEPWTSLPWVSTYLAMPATNKTLLFHQGPSSYVLVFPRTQPAR